MIFLALMKLLFASVTRTKAISAKVKLRDGQIEEKRAISVSIEPTASSSSTFIVSGHVTLNGNVFNVQSDITHFLKLKATMSSGEGNICDILKAKGYY